MISEFSDALEKLKTLLKDAQTTALATKIALIKAKGPDPFVQLDEVALALSHVSLDAALCRIVEARTHVDFVHCSVNRVPNA